MNQQPQNTDISLFRHSGDGPSLTLIKKEGLESYLNELGNDYVFLRTHNGIDEYCHKDSRENLLKAL
jgi:hypothetical protein